MQNYILRDYLQTLWRRRWLLMSCFGGMLLPAIILLKTLPPVYESIATIIYEEPKDTMIALDVGLAFHNKSGLLNLTELLKSRSLAVEVARTLPLDVLRTFNLPQAPSSSFSPEKIIAGRLQANLTILPVRGSDIVKINVQAHDPTAAQVIANTYAQRIIDWNLRKQRAEISSVRRFIEKQLAIFQDKLHAAEEALRAFKEKNKMLSLSETSAEMLKRLTQAEALHDRTKTEREAMERRYRYFEQKKRELAPTLTLPSGHEVQRHKQQLLELELQYAASKMNGTAAHVQERAEFEQKIDQVKEALVQELLQSAQGEELVDPLSQIRNLVQESVTLEVELATTWAREQALEKSVDAYEAQLMKLPVQELALARLLRARDVDERLYSMLQQRHEEVGIAEAGKIGDIQLIDGAAVASAPIRPDRRKFLAGGAILGLALGMTLAFLLESLDTSLKSQEEVEKYFSLPVVAAIPILQSNGTLHWNSNKRVLNLYDAKLLSHDNWNSPLYEAFRLFQMNFAFLNPDHLFKTILMTSAIPGEGKTLTSINLMQAFARNGVKTLLIDCDLRRPMIHKVLGCKNAPGLTDTLISKWELDRAILNFENDNAFVLPCGTLPPNPSEILDSQRMRGMLAELRTKYHLIILDSPPLTAVADSTILSTEVDGALLVIRSGSTSRDTATRALRLLERSRTKILGIILNAVDFRKTYGDYRNDGYYTGRKKERQLVFG